MMKIGTITEEEQVAQIIVHHIEQIYGQPGNVDDYNITVTDGTAGIGDNIHAFIRDRAFVEVNMIQSDSSVFERLSSDPLVTGSHKIRISQNVDYLDVMLRISQDVVVLTPFYDDNYQMMRDEELTVSGHTLSDIVRMLFLHNRLTSIVVFILPLRYNIKSLKRFEPKSYQLNNVIVCVIKSLTSK